MELQKAIPNDVVYFRRLDENEIIVTNSGPVPGMAGGYEVHHGDITDQHLVEYMEQAEFELLYSVVEDEKPKRTAKKAS